MRNQAHILNHVPLATTLKSSKHEHWIMEPSSPLSTIQMLINDKRFCLYKLRKFIVLTAIAVLGVSLAQFDPSCTSGPIVVALAVPLFQG